jgi:hypothetical protein
MMASQCMSSSTGSPKHDYILDTTDSRNGPCQDIRQVLSFALSRSATPTSAMPAAVFSDLGRREIASSRFLHESDQTWSSPAIGEVMFRLQHDYDETTCSRTYSDIRSSFVRSSENMRWKTDSEMRVVCGVRYAVESLTIDLANDFTYVPIPLTAILAGHEQRLGKA